MSLDAFILYQANGGKLESILTCKDFLHVRTNRSLLVHAGKVQVKVAQKRAAARHDAFDAKRKEAEILAADGENIETLESLAKELEKKSEGEE